MPSPKSKTRRSSRSPNRGTRRASRSANISWAGNDPLMQAMARGNLKWGDLLYSEVSSPSRSRSRSRSPKSPKMPRAPPPSREPSPINDVFNNFATPNLRRSEFIGEHFPVVLERIPDRSGRALYSVAWHRANFDKWRSERTSSFEEAMEYALFSELRLIHSLRKYPHLYALHEPRSKDEIVVIEMLGAARPRSPTRGAAAPRVPVLRKLNDITTHFPGVVVWGKVEGRKGESTYALNIRGDFHKKVKAPMSGRILADLEAALRASRFWEVLAPKRGEFLRLEMRHD